MSKKRRENPKAWSKRRKKKKGNRPSHVDPKGPGLRPPAQASYRNEFDQIGVLITEEQLQLSETDMNGLNGLASSLPFEPSVSVVSRLAGHAEGAAGNPIEQLKLAREFFGENELTDRYARLIESDSRSHIFGAQSLHSLMRILIENSEDGSIVEELDKTQRLHLMEAIVASNSITGRGIDMGVGPEQLDLLAYEIQIGNYYARPPWMEELSRARRLSERLTSDPDLLESPDAMPFAELAARGGISVDDQWKLGFGLGAIANAWDEKDLPYVAPAALNDLLDRTGLQDRKDQTLEVISATREQFQQAFVDLGADGSRFIWEMRPFYKWPFLRLENDNGLLLLSRPCLVNWLSDGFYFRSHSSAQSDDQVRAEGRRDHVQRLTSYWGKGYEAHCLDLAKEALADSCLVEGEQEYGRGGGKKTSDIAVLCGSDLVLFEVNGRMTAAEPLVSGSQEAAIDELKKQLIKKIDQLGVTVEAILECYATIPGINVSSLRRVIPVAVTTGRFWQTQTLWNHLDQSRDEEKCNAFKEANVLPPQLLRITEFEALLAICSGTEQLGDLLARRASGKYRHRDLAAWLKDEAPVTYAGERLPSVEASFENMIQELITDFRDPSKEEPASGSST